MEFGTGVMTITPWHDLADFDIAERHKLDKERVIDDRGLLLPIAGEFEGQHIKKARPLIVEKMAAKGLIERVDEKYVNRIATNSRGGGIIEPQIKRQWFVGVDRPFGTPQGKMTLKEWMRAVVEQGEIKIAPERFEKIYFHWINNLRDWCISRQIWFGHRIPAWHHEPRCIPKPGRESDVEKCIPIIVSIEKPTCQFCDAQYEQDPDVLDTWFSSGLWTFSTLGWPFDYAQGKPKPGSDLATYHPTSVLETGYDILFFWVARMVLMSGFLLGQVPFRNVYLHGLVRDGQGRKMSKSLGNIIDPLDMIKKYGADATRLSLIIGAAPGTDLKLSEDRVRGYKHFANKLWNITRFVLENSEDKYGHGVSIFPEDKKLVEEAEVVAKEVSGNIDNFRLDLAADRLYHYVWDRFAAEIIEESKPIFKAGGEAAASRSATLYALLTTSLTLLHPFMPFVTEAIWQQLPKKENDMLMVAKWPTS